MDVSFIHPFGFFKHVQIGIYFNFEAKIFGIGLTCWDLQPLQPNG